MKSNLDGIGSKSLNTTLALLLSVSPISAKDLAKKVKDILGKNTDKDAPTLVNTFQGKTSHIIETNDNGTTKEKKEAIEYNDWGFPEVEFQSYKNVLNEIMSKELSKFLLEKEGQDGKKYKYYRQVEKKSFVDFMLYLDGYYSLKNKDGEQLEVAFLNTDPKMIEDFLPSGGYKEKIRGFREEFQEYNADMYVFKNKGLRISNLDTLIENVSIALRILNSGNETFDTAIRERHNRKSAVNAEGVVNQRPVLDSLNRIYDHANGYVSDLREKMLEPCIEGREFFIEDIEMMIKYYKSQGISTSPDANGNHKPDRIKVADWRKIQDENPQYQTESYKMQKAMEAAAE